MRSLLAFLLPRTIFWLTMICCHSASQSMFLIILVLLTRSLHSLDLAAGRRLLAVGGGARSCCKSWSTPTSVTGRQSSPGMRSEQKYRVSFRKHTILGRNGEAVTSLTLSRGGASSGTESTTNRASDVLSYYLLWSPGVFRKTVVSIFVLLALRVASTPFQSQLAGLATSSSSSPFGFVLQVLVLPLLSSACCGIQLAINALVGAGGCAGFNKYLGPLRPYFLSVLFVSTATTFPAHHSRTADVQWLQRTLLRWCVALMPEMVQLWNVYVAERTRRRRNEMKVGDVVATIELTIPTMGCVACINKIDSSMQKCAPNQIEEAKSWLEPSGKGGKALVRGVASSKQDAEKLAESLVQAVRAAGFEPCSVESIRIEQNPEAYDGMSQSQ